MLTYKLLSHTNTATYAKWQVTHAFMWKNSANSALIKGALFAIFI